MGIVYVKVSTIYVHACRYCEHAYTLHTHLYVHQHQHAHPTIRPPPHTHILTFTLITSATESTSMYRCNGHCVESSTAAAARRNCLYAAS